MKSDIKIWLWLVGYVVWKVPKWIVILVYGEIRRLMYVRALMEMEMEQERKARESLS